MRKNFGAKPYLYPMPVFIVAAYDENGKPNAMNAAWGGMSEDTEISLCLSPFHKTVKDILASGAFTVSMADAAHVVECDYVGVVSGNDEPEKMAKSGLHTTKSEFVNAPLIDELPMAVECTFKSYDAENCRMVGEIVNVCADERILDAEGNIDVTKLDPITYDPVSHEYRRLGDVAGKAFSDGLKLKK